MTEETFPEEGRIAGIDFGTVRIGIAITDVGQRMASPLENYTRQGESRDGVRFQRLVNEEEIVGFVVGLPILASGDESAKSQEARQFGAWLQQQTSCPVTYFDERYTSVQAEQILGAAKLTKKKRKQRLDMLAAQIMLAAFLESGPNGLPESLD